MKRLASAETEHDDCSQKDDSSVSIGEQNESKRAKNESPTAFSSSNMKMKQQQQPVADEFSITLQRHMKAPAALIQPQLLKSMNSASMNAWKKAGSNANSRSASTAGTPTNETAPPSPQPIKTIVDEALATNAVTSVEEVDNALGTKELTGGTFPFTTPSHEGDKTLVVSIASPPKVSLFAERIDGVFNESTLAIDPTPTAAAGVSLKSASPAAPSPESSSLSSPMTETQVNQIAAKLMRAEMLGDEAKISKLKAELEAARSSLAASSPVVRGTGTSSRSHMQEKQSGSNFKQMKSLSHASEVSAERHKDEAEPGFVIVSGRTDKSGQLMPLPTSYQNDIKSLAQRERLGASVEDYDRDFYKASSKVSRRAALNDDYDLGDAIEERSNASKSSGKSSKSSKKPDVSEEDRAKQRAVMDHKHHQEVLDKCHFCQDAPSQEKHLVICTGINCYLALPSNGSLTNGHCLIIPKQHIVSVTTADEDVVDEINLFRKFLVKMFLAQGEDVVFLETVMRLKYQNHTVVECIPISKELGDVAPMYYKKAIMECESEWAQNKKLVETKGKGIRRSVPQGFPYFNVEFGIDFGYAHVIEDEEKFSKFFGKEVVGGMLELEPHSWLRPKKETIAHQNSAVKAFRAMWQPYDWTRRLERTE